MAKAVGSSIFFTVSLFVITGLVLLLLRYYLPLRTTPGYLLFPVFLALALPSSIVLLVPIDLASNAGTDTGTARGIWLPERALLVAWRISYWLTFLLTWIALPLLGEYSDSGYREPKDRFLYSLRSNGRYQLMVVSTASLGAVYFFLSEGFHFLSLKALAMALAYTWGLILAIYLMGHGLVALPKRLFRDACISGRLRRLQSHAPKIHEKLTDATDDLAQYEQQVFQLKQRKNGTAKEYREWIDDLAELASTPENRITASAAVLPSSRPTVPQVITERYLADLSRLLKRARHKKMRYLSEWEHLIQNATRMQTILDSYTTKRLDFGSPPPYASRFEKLTILTPYLRFILHSTVIPGVYYTASAITVLASMGIVWSEVIKSISPKLSVIGLTVVHHSDTSRGQIGFAGQCIAAAWLCYMCACALWSITEFKAWGNRALVRRATYEESACWYAGQVAKLTVPLSYNFTTMMKRDVSEATVFHSFLGVLVDLTPLGKGVSRWFPCLVMVPVVMSLFGLYGKIKEWFGFGDWIDEEDEIGGWREGRNLIDREVRGQGASLGLTPRVEGSRDTSLDIERPRPGGTIPAASTRPSSSRPARVGRPERQRLVQPDGEDGGDEEAEEGNFFTDFARRVKNTLDTNMDTPVWFTKPKWMGGDEEGGGGDSSATAGLSRWFGRPPDGRLRL
ncbi:hypothetical protein EJ08DRAFT_636426 [Tothia fuscella]|uniref:Uncharacterized protein n=1 Tax=Tothia fuscella TaxID=1048955 RepID=A0A9P4NP43_9PEZI|nr:hypothetical protein EJ08DRAFT_636426 [Tothia fuscella]